MSALIYAMLVIVPICALTAVFVASFKAILKGGSHRRVLKNNALACLLILIISVSLAFTACAVDTDADSAPAEQSAQTVEDTSNSKGLGLLAAAIVTSLAGIGGGIAVAAGAPAAIAATSEDSKNFGKSLIFVALGESIALYGVVISILILNKT